MRDLKQSKREKKSVLRSKLVQGLEFFGPMTLSETRNRLAIVNVVPSMDELKQAMSELVSEGLVLNHGSNEDGQALYSYILN